MAVGTGQGGDLAEPRTADRALAGGTARSTVRVCRLFGPQDDDPPPGKG